MASAVYFVAEMIGSASAGRMVMTFTSERQVSRDDPMRRLFGGANKRLRKYGLFRERDFFADNGRFEMFYSDL